MLDNLGEIIQEQYVKEKELRLKYAIPDTVEVLNLAFIEKQGAIPVVKFKDEEPEHIEILQNETHLNKRLKQSLYRIQVCQSIPQALEFFITI